MSTPQEEEDQKVRADLQALVRHVDPIQDAELGRLRQRIAELEYALLHPFSAESFALREEIARLKGL